MKRSKFKKGDKLAIKNASGEHLAFFIERIPAEAGQRAVNLLRVPAYAGLNGPSDIGICEMNDRELSKRAEHA